MRELQERKRQLVAESDVYRERLLLEVQTLRLYGAGLRERLNSFRAMNPLFLAAASLLGLRLGGAARPRRKRHWLRLVLTSMAGWQVYRQVEPLIQMFLKRRSPPKETEAAAPAPAPAAGL